MSVHMLLCVHVQAGVHPEQPGKTVNREGFESLWRHSVLLLQRGFKTGSILTVDEDEAKKLGKPWTRRLSSCHITFTVVLMLHSQMLWHYVHSCCLVPCAAAVTAHAQCFHSTCTVCFHTTSTVGTTLHPQLLSRHIHNCCHATSTVAVTIHP